MLRLQRGWEREGEGSLKEQQSEREGGGGGVVVEEEEVLMSLRQESGTLPGPHCSCQPISSEVAYRVEGRQPLRAEFSLKQLIWSNQIFFLIRLVLFFFWLPPSYSSSHFLFFFSSRSHWMLRPHPRSLSLSHCFSHIHLNLAQPCLFTLWWFSVVL